MQLDKIQRLLTERYKGDHSRVARIAHFIGLIKTGRDGLLTMGVVLELNATGLDDTVISPAEPNVLESLESAIAHMQRASERASN